VENTRRRVQVNQGSIEVAISVFKECLSERLAEKGYGTFASSHEILGVITEEYHELQHAVEANDKRQVRHELLDLAVGAIFGVACYDQETCEW